MCGRAYRKTPTGNLAKHFKAEAQVELDANYNLGPTQDIAAVRVNKEGDARELVSLYWGLLPPWVKDDGKRPPMLNNAKAETAHEKNSFRSPFKKTRCLIVFDGFYEWFREDKKNKRPFLTRRKDGAPIAMAGLWQYNKAFDLESGTVLTIGANSLLSQIHTRMPVILEEEAQKAWLDPAAEVPMLRELLTPCDPDLLEMFEVSKHVNNIRNNDETCMDPLPAEDA